MRVEGPGGAPMTAILGAEHGVDWTDTASFAIAAAPKRPTRGSPSPFSREASRRASSSPMRERANASWRGTSVRSSRWPRKRPSRSRARAASPGPPVGWRSTKRRELRTTAGTRPRSSGRSQGRSGRKARSRWCCSRCSDLADDGRGDRARRSSRRSSAVTRTTDTVFRRGRRGAGRAAPADDGEGAQRFHGRLRAELERSTFTESDELTVSTGISEWRPDETSDAFDARARAPWERRGIRASPPPSAERLSARIRSTEVTEPPTTHSKLPWQRPVL